MKKSPLAPARTFLAFGAFALVVVAAMAFIKSQSTHRLSIEDKANISALANRICKSASANNCPIEWGGNDKGFAKLLARTGKPVVSLEQVRGVLNAPPWVESTTRDGWSLDNGKYSVTVVPSSGDIVILPL